MKKIENIKRRLHDDRVYEVLALSHFQPTIERMRALAETYEKDDAVSVFGWYDEGRLEGVIALRKMDGRAYEIMSIAVDSASRRKGIGSALIEYAKAQKDCDSLCAETDDDAVGFYRRLGFFVVSLGEKYENVTRYLCTL